MGNGILIIIPQQQHHKHLAYSSYRKPSYCIGHCTHTSESANVKVHYTVNTGTSDMGTINSSDRIAATLYSLGTLLSQEYMYKYPA
jgi:hypothetical protein